MDKSVHGRRSAPQRFEFGFSGRSDGKARIKQRVDAMDNLVQASIARRR
jgi:hypothetical protein